jgi:hypothetical protein
VKVPPESVRHAQSQNMLMNIQQEDHTEDQEKKEASEMNWLTKSDINFFKKEATYVDSEILSSLVNDKSSN